jgi:hypothetical protein
MDFARRFPVYVAATAFTIFTCGCQALDHLSEILGGDDGSGSGGRQTRVELDIGPAPTTVGTGSCLEALPFPRSCYTEPGGGVACTVGGSGPKAVGTANLMIHPNGCVGSLRILDAGVTPDLAGAKAFAAPNRVSGTPCCAEASPGSEIPHIVSFDPQSRAFFIRSAEPITGPTQVSMMANSYFWRFYVGGEPPAP